MGYDLVIRPKDGFEKFKDESQAVLDIKYIKIDILAKILNAKYLNIYALELDINNLIAHAKREVFRSRTKEFKESGELYYRGWRYSQDHSYDDDFYSDYKWLWIMNCVVPTPDWYEEEGHEKLTQKSEYVEARLDYIIEVTQEICEHEIIDFYKEFSDEDKEVFEESC